MFAYKISQYIFPILVFIETVRFGVLWGVNSIESSRLLLDALYNMHYYSEQARNLIQFTFKIYILQTPFNSQVIIYLTSFLGSLFFFTCFPSGKGGMVYTQRHSALVFLLLFQIPPLQKHHSVQVESHPSQTAVLNNLKIKRWYRTFVETRKLICLF